MSWKWNFVINVLGKGGAVLVAFLFTPVFVRMMGIEAYSLVALFITFLSVTFVLDFAFGATMTRELARYSLTPEKADEARDLARSLEHLYLYVGLLLAAGCYFASPWISAHWLNLRTLSFETVRNSVALMGFAIGLQVPLGMYVGGMYGLDRQPVLNLTQFVMSVLRYGGAVAAMLVFEARPEVFFSWQLAFSFVQTLVMRSLLWRYIPAGSRSPRFSLSVLRGTFHFTSRVTGTAIASFIVNQLDKIVLSKLMPLPVLGSYQIGNQLGNATRLPSTLLETVVMPRMVIHAEKGDHAAMRVLYHESCQMVALITLPFAAAMLFFAEPLVTLWIGNGTVAAAAAPVAAILTLGSALNALVRVPAGVTLARGWAAFGLYESIISGIVFVPMLIVLIHFHGATGAASAWLILNIGYLLIDIPIIHARMLPGEIRSWIVWSAATPLLVAFGIFGVVRALLPPCPTGVASIVAGATWIVASLACAFAMPRTRAIAHRAIVRILSR
jgi:O-antigen/teichoic acid export membrane protein